MEELIADMDAGTTIPLWIKTAYTVFVLILVPVYWKKWGLANFLWFSDIALFVMLAAVWLESRLLASMMAVGVLAPEIAWNIAYFTRLLTGKNILSLTNYMFDSSKPLYLRALSLFHVILPALVIWMLVRFGFHENALFYQLALGWVVLLVTFLFTNPSENINWVFGPGEKPQTKMNPASYFLLIVAAFTFGLYIPSYLLLRWLF
ncbi:membrane-associated protein [Botryobacter ruber]|uniref:membrane-associated protein n=1 Tax=Botryobacter ruber TaxID=2171629 RepID=UPI001F0C41EF|nr:membrane-associated protein [Botryobacter ruber]